MPPRLVALRIAVLFFVLHVVDAHVRLRTTRKLTLELTTNDVEVVASRVESKHTDLEALYGIHNLHGYNVPADQIVRIYYHLNGRTMHHDTVQDPRFEISEWKGQDGKLTGAEYFKPHGHIIVTVPAEAKHITIARHTDLHESHQRLHTLAIPHQLHFVRRKFLAQATGTTYPNAGPTSRPQDLEQKAGHPDHHKNLVFLPAGFRDVDKMKFKAAVYSAATAFMNGDMRYSTADGLIPTPWDRYMSLVNVYVVWQPSIDSGATIPLKANGQPHEGYSGAVNKKNNLGCTYGNDVLRFLSCDITAMRTLALDNTPVNEKSTTIIALVNDVAYGGTGGGRYTSVYAGDWEKCPDATDCIAVCKADDEGCPAGEYEHWRSKQDNKFMQVLIHELGHADSYLADEYDYKVSASRTVRSPNCHVAQADPPWQHWVGLPLGVMQPTMDGGSCSYTGYYKPTPDLCLMNTQRAELCAACAEQIILSVYRDTKDLASPRCPGVDETMIVVDNNDWHKLEMSGKFVEAGTTHRDDSTWYARAHDGLLLTPRYKACQDAAAARRLVRKKSDTVPTDEVLCTDRLNKIPLRLDAGDIPHTWVWPSSARSDPVPLTGKQPDSNINPREVPNPWKQTSGGRWAMTGHVKWITDPNSGHTGSIPEVFFQGSRLGPGLHYFELTIVDETEFVIKSAWGADPRVGNMTYMTSFRVEVVAQDNATYRNCTGALVYDAASPTTTQCSAGRNRFAYCAVCDEGAICNNSYPYRPFEAQADVLAVVDALEAQIMGIGGAIAGGGVIALMVIWCIFGECTSKRVNEVIPFGTTLKVCRFLFMGSAFLIMVAAVAIAALGIYFYSGMTFVVKLAIMATIMIAAVVYLLAFLGFTAAFFHSRVQLAINGILLLVVVLTLIVLSAAVLYTGGQITTGYQSWETLLIDQWEAQVRQNPKSICTFQATFQCSGLTISCHNKFHSQCPNNCDLTNLKYPNPCYAGFRTQFDKYYIPAAAAMLGITAAMLMGLILNWVLCCAIRQRVKTNKHRLMAVPEGGAAHNDLVGVRVLRNLRPDEFRRLQEQFLKHDTSGTGKMSPMDLRKFYKRCLKITLNTTDLDALVRRFDGNHNGHIEWAEFVAQVKQTPS